MRNRKEQIKINQKELRKNAKRYRKRKNKETKQIRIPNSSYRAIMDHKKENGKTGSYWIDEAWRWYQKQFNFERKE